MTLLALLTSAAFVTGADAAKTSIMHRFDGSDGTNPATALTLGPDGRLYGTTIAAGKFNRGTVFAIHPNTGAFTTLHNFANDEGSDPYGQLLVASDGNLYGTTRYGGDPNCPSGCGTIYRISPTGNYATLHVMTELEGATLQGGLIEGPGGLFYGTATMGGDLNCHGVGASCGTVYAFSPATLAVTVLHKFNFTDGRWPYGRLVLASNGYLYGTTSSGAAGEAGTVYRIKPSGKGFSTLVEFANTTAGCQPKAGPIQADNGSLYGVTEDCGNNNSGAIYSVSPRGEISTLHRFNADGYARDGKNSTAELLQPPAGSSMARRGSAACPSMIRTEMAWCSASGRTGRNSNSCIPYEFARRCAAHQRPYAWVRGQFVWSHSCGRPGRISGEGYCLQACDREMRTAVSTALAGVCWPCPSFAPERQ